MRILLAAVLTYISIVSIGFAQTRHNVLRGMNEVDLLIEELSPGAKPCGITNELIERAFMYPASSARFRVSKTAAATFYIKVTTINSPSRGCLSSVGVQVYSYQSVQLDFSGRTAFATVEVWRTGTIFAGPSDGQQVRESVENFVKSFITDWNLDNRP